MSAESGGCRYMVTLHSVFQKWMLDFNWGSSMHCTSCEGQNTRDKNYQNFRLKLETRPE